MADMEFTYKGKKVVVREKHPGAIVSVDGREFSCHHHHPPRSAPGDRAVPQNGQLPEPD